MSSVRPCELPQTSLLREARERGAYTDCFATEVPGSVSQSSFIEAFYTTALFKVERVILSRLAARPSTDIEAHQLAQGTTASFAAWRVEGRTADQLLLADLTGRTKSWLMVVPVASDDAIAGTRLYFGSAVVSRVDARSGRRRMSFAFHTLLGFHKLYSRLLLGAARSRLLACRNAGLS